MSIYARLLGDGVPMDAIDRMDMLRYLEVYAVEMKLDADRREPEGGWTRRGTIDEVF